MYVCFLSRPPSFSIFMFRRLPLVILIVFVSLPMNSTLSNAISNTHLLPLFSLSQFQNKLYLTAVHLFRLHGYADSFARWPNFNARQPLSSSAGSFISQLMSSDSFYLLYVIRHVRDLTIRYVVAVMCHSAAGFLDIFRLVFSVNIQ